MTSPTSFQDCCVLFSVCSFAHTQGIPAGLSWPFMLSAMFGHQYVTLELFEGFYRFNKPHEGDPDNQLKVKVGLPSQVITFVNDATLHHNDLTNAGTCDLSHIGWPSFTI